MASQSVEVPWVDAWIRWERNSKQEDNDSIGNSDSSDSNDVDNEFLPPPTESYTFTYTTPGNNIRITLKLDGYHSDSEQTRNSTGLTLWRSSHYLCQYLVDHTVEWMPNHNSIENNNEKKVKILEVGSGLGRCGILAHLLSQAHGYDTKTLLTDGDTDTLKQLRQNVRHNIKNDDGSIECRQLLWGKEYVMQYIQQQQLTGSKTFDLIIGSDLLYVPSVIQPLFETVLHLLNPDSGKFLMAHCCRRVGNDVTLEEVLSVAKDLGFECEEKVRNDEDIVLYSFTVNA